MQKLDMESKDLVQSNIEKLKEFLTENFPSSVNEWWIDIDALKQELSTEVIDSYKERYQLTWPGKKDAIATANARCNKTLRPVREKSVDFDNTKNIYIEWDNLEALKILQESYLNKIKCIYIDPPYNTGKDFVYDDNFYKKTKEELLDSGIIDEYGNILISEIINSDSNSKFHSNWLSMMYPRLKLARNLLSDDWLIFISIDNTEQSNLRKMCDEIFWEKNFISLMPRKTTEHIRVLADYELQNLNDYVVCYCKNIEKVKINKKAMWEIKYPYEDDRWKYTLKAFQNSWENWTRKARPNLYYPIYFNESTWKLSLDKTVWAIEILPKKVKWEDWRWLWSKEKFINDNNLLEYKWWTLYRKAYYDENEDNTKYESYKTWLDMYPNRLWAKELNDLWLAVFDYSKPVELIKFLVWLIYDEDSIILDFFSGSATSAQAALEVNSENQWDMSFIMIQLSEKTEDDSPAYKAGYKNICEIWEERIRRAWKKIKEETNADIDYWFRVYKVDSSNMKDVFYKPWDLDQNNLFDSVSNVKEDRSWEDLLTQVILDLGLPLDLKIEEKKIWNQNIFFVEENYLIACFNDNIDLNIVEEIAKYEPKKVVFKDSSFKSDQDKINLQEKFKRFSPSTEINIL